MGTWAHVVAVRPPPGALERAQRRIEQLEARWSRFLPDSEVSRLNRAEGRPVLVSADTVMLVRRAIQGCSATAGRFDPTLLGPLLAAGYDRSFEDIDDTGSTSSDTRTTTAVHAIAIDDHLGAVTLPDGAGFDPGGIGKGLAADLTVAGLLAEGAEGACVNLGGDLRAEGRSPDGGPWVIEIAQPFGHNALPLPQLAFDAGGVATSSPLRRSWLSGEQARHHLIDPATGRPAWTDVAAVTVLTGDAWRAEILAKAAVLAGAAEALRVLEGAGATGLVIDARGTVRRAASLAPFES